MISIKGLNQQQVEMLDILWEFEELHQVKEWQATLNKHDLLMSQSLIELILIETLDLETKNTKQATEYLNQFRL